MIINLLWNYIFMMYILILNKHNINLYSIDELFYIKKQINSLYICWHMFLVLIFRYSKDERL